VLVPKLVTTLRGYTREQLYADATAGVIVGIVALPLAIAFAIASGVTPERGLYTAIVAGFSSRALGGSRVQIGGPTGAFVVIVYAVVQKHGLDGLTVATLMAGGMLLAFGLLGLGGAIKFIRTRSPSGSRAAIGPDHLFRRGEGLPGAAHGIGPGGLPREVAAIASHLGAFEPGRRSCRGGEPRDPAAVGPRVNRRIPDRSSRSS